MAVYIYSNCSTIITGCRLYTDSCLTTPVTDGYYSDLTNYFVVSGGLISSSSSCSGPTNYYHYTVTVYDCLGSSCVASSYTPTFGLVAYATPLTIGTYYYDTNTNHIFKIETDYGFGNYGGLIIVIGGSSLTCSVLCNPA